MRILAGIFAVLLVLFALVQYNDPDALYWGVIYGVTAGLCFVAAWGGGLVVSPAFRIIVVLAALVAAIGVFVYWPETPRWWAQDVWWETETAREGMGMMIVFIASLVAVLATFRRARVIDGSGHQG